MQFSFVVVAFWQLQKRQTWERFNVDSDDVFSIRENQEWLDRAAASTSKDNHKILKEAFGTSSQIIHILDQDIGLKTHRFS